jgi:tetratricopeptide (TPR) repeat protein
MVYANMGAVWALLGDKDKAQNYFAKAEKAKLPETNSFENRVALASALIVSGDVEAACKALKGTSDTPSSWQLAPLMQQLAATPAQVEPFVTFLYKHKWHNEFEVLEGLVDALIQEAAWDKLKKWIPRFDRLSTTACEQRIALAQSGHGQGRGQGHETPPPFNPSTLETALTTADTLEECKTIGQKLAQGGRMDLARLAFQKARTVIRLNCKDLDLEELLTAQAEAGDLEGAYESLMLIPKGKRSYRNRGLLTICAKTKNYAALADLLLKMPSDDMNHRPQASLRCLRIIADVPGTGTLF